MSIPWLFNQTPASVKGFFFFAHIMEVSYQLILRYRGYLGAPFKGKTFSLANGKGKSEIQSVKGFKMQEVALKREHST